MNFETDDRMDTALKHLAYKYNMKPADVLRRGLAMLVSIEEQLAVGGRRLVMVDEGNNVIVTYKVFEM